MTRFNQIPKLIFLLALLFAFSCNNDDGDDGIAVVDGCSASWKLDGVDSSEDNLSLCIFLDNTLNLSTTLTGGAFQLQIDPISGPGTYVADATNTDLNVAIILRQDGTQLLIKNGQVVVSELSNSKAKGTFSGNFYDIMDLNQDPVFSVTEGKFEANF